MNTPMRRIRTRHMLFTTAAGVLGGLLVANAPVFAQDQEVITVTAPRTVDHRVIDRNPVTRAELEEVSLSRGVSYAGLDLGKPADVAEVEKRIDATAQEACQQLDKLYTLMKSDKDCVEKAAAEAKASLQAIIAARSK
jgi:UrcA family protein